MEAPRSMNAIPYRYRIHTLSIYRDGDTDQDETRLRARVRHAHQRGESERGETRLVTRDTCVTRPLHRRCIMLQQRCVTGGAEEGRGF